MCSAGRFGTSPREESQVFLLIVVVEAHDVWPQVETPLHASADYPWPLCTLTRQRVQMSINYIFCIGKGGLPHGHTCGRNLSFLTSRRLAPPSTFYRIQAHSPPTTLKFLYGGRTIHNLLTSPGGECCSYYHDTYEVLKSLFKGFQYPTPQPQTRCPAFRKRCIHS